MVDQFLKRGKDIFAWLWQRIFHQPFHRTLKIPLLGGSSQDLDTWLGSPHLVFINHLGHLEGEQNYLGNLWTMVINHVQTRMILQVAIWSSQSLPARTNIPTYCWWFRNPERKPPVIYETLWQIGYCPYQLVSRISEPSTVLFHYRTVQKKNHPWPLLTTWQAQPTKK